MHTTEAMQIIEEISAELELKLQDLLADVLGEYKSGVCPQLSRVSRVSQRQHGKFGFGKVIRGILVDEKNEIIGNLNAERHGEMVSQLAVNPKLLWANWMGLNGAKLDFDLLVDVYLHLCGFELSPPVVYMTGASSSYPRRELSQQGELSQ